jgi:thermostable 8-oxoguanine DNA glycosylase
MNSFAIKIYCSRVRITLGNQEIFYFHLKIKLNFFYLVETIGMRTTASPCQALNDTEINSFLYLNQKETNLPKKEAYLMPGVKWGNYCQLYTPAFWKFMYHSVEFDDQFDQHRLGNTILEETVACLLGGYGMPSELGLAAFERLKNESLIIPGIDLKKIQKALSTPFSMPDGTLKKYRFYNQKSKYIYNLLQRSDLNSIPTENDLLLRNWLISVEGIGPKTASWVTRNWLQSENVAILDIHILRAGKIAGFFKEIDNVSKNYFELEGFYIAFCKALEVLPSNMDAIIWSYMKKTNKLALKALAYS